MVHRLQERVVPRNQFGEPRVKAVRILRVVTETLPAHHGSEVEANPEVEESPEVKVTLVEQRQSPDLLKRESKRSYHKA